YIQMDGYLVSLSVAIGVDGKGEKECDAGPFTLKVSWIEDETDTVVKVDGYLEHDLGDSFRSVVDLQISIGEKDTKWIVGSLWPENEMSTVWRRKRRAKKNAEEKIVVKYRTNVLSMHNLIEPNRSRSFRVLCASKCWFVNVNRLIDHGGIFVEWKKLIEQNVFQVVSMEDPFEMGCLLESLVAYDQPVVHRHNYSILLPIASRLRLHKLMRVIEDWLMQSHFHIIRLLEISVMYRMSRLYDFGTKELGPPMEALRTLHVYLAECNCTLNDLPPSLYAAFKITPRTITM
ncbi:hypothetical protein PRIPAC_72476, partial [Pristionchus pacificus]|uniref:Uncharacterized protein n=1 Tax=Pristionchus pacificus TaxID=54126 RepID=A0A8R1Z9R0_PRIPA